MGNAYYDELVSLRSGGDSGDNTPESIQPVVNTEHVWAEFTGRPGDNLRQRTEILRRALQNVNYFLDYDRALVLRADAAFTFTEVTSGNYALTLAASGSAWAVPALTPGRQSGGRNKGGAVFCSNASAAGAWTPYSGTVSVDDFSLTASGQYTGQRGYADTDDFSDTPAGRSLGANRLRVRLVADPMVLGGVGTITAVIDEDPAVRVTITYGTGGGGTTLANLISFVNSDHSSQGTYGLAELFRASTASSGASAPVPYSDGVVQGSYDAEAHEVTKAQFDGFFAATVGGSQVNLLREGEGLAIGYPLGPVESAVSSPSGGRRQSLFDLPTDRAGGSVQHTTPSSGWLLFSTGREPEKIPGAVPIGKVINGEFVFIDGTRIAPGETLSLGESRTTNLLLARLTTGDSGARRVGFEGGTNWNGDASATTSPGLIAETVYDTFTRIVADLATQATSQSGARRVGAEALAGTPSIGNESRGLSLAAGSVRTQVAALLNDTSNGLNHRVSEFGHRMIGAAPLRKEFAASGMPSAGAVLTQAELHPPVNMMAATPAGVQEYASLDLQPLAYANGSDADDVIASTTALAFSSATALLFSMSGAQFTKVFSKLPVIADGLTGGIVPMIFVKITNLVGCNDAADGMYYVVGTNTGTKTATFRRIDGTSPDFTGLSSSPNATVFTGVAVGNDFRYTRVTALFRGDLVANGAGRAPVMIGLSGPLARVAEVWGPNANTGVLYATRYGNRTDYALTPTLGAAAYAGGTTYVLNQTVTYSGVTYVSIQNANTGHQPDVSPLWWTPSPTVGRSTDNLLIAPDKAVLSGYETNTPLDASGNHHHAGLYSGFVTLNADVSGDLTTFTALSAKHFDLSPPSGTQYVAVEVYFEITVVATAAGAVNCVLHFSNSDGTRVYNVMPFLFTASGGGQSQTVRGSITVPVAGSQYFVYCDSTTNVDKASSSYALTVYAAHTIRA